MFTFTIDKNLELKLLEHKDSKELFELVHHNRSYLRQWLPWVDKMNSPDDYKPVIDMWLKQFADNDGFQAGILYNKELAGMIGYHGIDWGNKQTSLGYWIAEDYQGKGIITRAAKGLLDYSFKEYKLNRVEIRCGVNNKKSRAIPERLHFTQEGIQRDGENLYGQFHDIVLYSMLARDWK
ncbi:GNAT family protein [Salinibacillus aidingensis]|uniref:GNAT family protein n=1 Tax=Salinibacillus aidingensis TaxID=237684 RepID=A0ABN1BN28_9BACI